MFTPSKMKTAILIALVVTLFYPAALNGLQLSCTGFKCSDGQECVMRTILCLMPPCPLLPHCIAGLVCPQGEPYKTPGPDGSMNIFQCGGFAGIACPRTYNCVITAPGADRFGICCPPAKPLCPNDLVYKTCGSSCARTCNDPNPICSLVCKPGCFCPDTTPIQHFGGCIREVQCPAQPVSKCPSGQPLKDYQGIEIHCGMARTQQDCPDSHFCNVHPTDLFAVCCPKSTGPQRTCQDVKCPDGQFCKMTAVVCIRAPCLPVPLCIDNRCPRGRPYTENAKIFQCGGIRGIPCPSGHDCIPDGPGADRTGTCCPEECPTGLVYMTCGTSCPPACEYTNRVCDAVCMRGCFCPDTAPVRHNGRCIRMDDCPSTPEPVCRQGDPIKISGSLINFRCGGIAGIGCPAGYNCVITASGADRFGICCPPECPTGLVYNTCGTSCPPTCEGPTPICNEMCVAGCFCPDTAPVRHNGRCISKDDCPPPDPTPDPVCRQGEPHKTSGQDGSMMNFRCAGTDGIRCPAGYICLVTAPGVDRLGVCCPSKKKKVPTATLR